MSPLSHQGEIFIKEQMSINEDDDFSSSMIKKEMPPIAMQFLENINFCVINFTINHKELYSCVVFDSKQFITVLNSTEISINLENRSHIPKEIENSKNLSIGFLGLDFENRMRIRINGKGSIDKNTLHLKIKEVYSNCPKYIDNRKIIGKIDFLNQPILKTYQKLCGTCEEIIKNTNTIFLSSSHPYIGCDVSHKGGEKGFLKVISPTKLELDDYAGNNMYNSLGNIHINPNISILAINFATHDVLHINGVAYIEEYFEGEKKSLKILVECLEISVEENKFFLQYDK